MRKIFLILFIIFPAFLMAQSNDQTEKDYIRKGNELYSKKKYNDAEVNYLKSLEKNKDSYIGNFNLGDALYKQGKYDKAAEKFSDLGVQKLDKSTLSKTYHNLGNSLLKDGKYPESIDAYKRALRDNPKDLDTKYNLEYARRMLIQQQQQQQKQQNQKQNQQQNQKQQQQQQNKDQDKKDNKQQQQQQQQQQQSKISKDDAKRMLSQIDNEEKNTQKKQKKKLVHGAKTRPDKPW
ncbi:MAG: tetratricopeptide repeat protein [FCB group bacterium]|jgi:tetratricopeptide (TPR) repeat protein